MSLNFHDTIAGPTDLAGFIDPPETGLQQKPHQSHIYNNTQHKALSSLVKAAARNIMMKVAISSVQKAETGPWIGLVIIISDSMPYTRLPIYVANTEPTVWDTM
ncbi:putative aquaporin NIP7-1 [Senna tora]|uniref:Putative aquaporin NIP7-1 n=1 Tax=Senna tora TaxID=362788 RepID=A0A834X2W5_9FABA|nr:putative aquaporin NIP7-1 [Senna tora]